MTTTPSNSTPPFRITVEGKYRTEGGHVVDVRKRNVPGSQFQWEYNHPGERDFLCSVRDDGSQYFGRGVSGPYNIVSRCDDAPSPVPTTNDRLTRAKAALEGARAALSFVIRAYDAAAENQRAAFGRVNDARAELAAAEKEAEAAQARVEIPAGLLQVAREVMGADPYDTRPMFEVWALLAKSHGITMHALRARLESEKT